jgi:hypothetical protein
MTNRETMRSLLSGVQPESTPQWLMAFASTGVAQRLMPDGCVYEGYGEYPDADEYPFGPMGESLLARQVKFNTHIDRVAFPVGWGANAAFGHSGPGEFNKRVIDRTEHSIVVEYETGVRKEIRSSPHNVRIFDHPVKSPESLAALELPVPQDPDRYSGFASDVALAKSKGEWTVGWVNGFFSGVHYFLREYAEFLMDLAAEPQFARALIGRLGEWTLAAAGKLCEAGVDCIGFCDDLGSGQSMLISPALYRELIFPWHQRLCRQVHEQGAVVHLHSHGAIMPVAGDLAEAGFDILNPIDPDDQMPLAEVREIVGPKMILCGGMSKYFFDWDRDRQADCLKRVVADGRKLGPHILMDAGGIPENVTRQDFDEFLSMSRATRKDG